MDSLHRSDSRYSDEDVAVDVTLLTARSRQHAPPRKGRSASRSMTPAPRQKVSRAKPNPSRRARTRPVPEQPRKQALAQSVPRRDSYVPHSRFRIFRSPWREQIARRQAFSRTTAADSGLGDALSGIEPTAEQIAFVKALNTKFRRLEDALGAPFRAYCGGKAGYMVRRFSPGCDTDDVLSQNKPIGMGPKGLETYFQKHYRISWARFLSAPSDELGPMLAKAADDAAAPRTASKKRAPKHTAEPKTPTRPKAKTQRKAASDRKAAPDGTAAPMPQEEQRSPRAEGTRSRFNRQSQSAAPPPGNMPVPSPQVESEGAEDKELDAIAESMRELKELIAKAMK